MKARVFITEKSIICKTNKKTRRYKKLSIVYPHISRRNYSGTTYERLRVKLKFDEKIYHQRSKVESVFSTIKRNYRSIVRGKSFDMQQKEMICKIIAYNQYR